MIPRRVVAGLGAAALAALVAPALSAYPLTLLTQAAIIAILAMSLDVLLGYTGLPSLGHAAYFGVAAYAVGILTVDYQCSFLTCLVVGVALATLTAAIFGLLAIRAAGTYFLMITLALGMVVWGLAFRWVSMTKGDNGIAGVPRPELGLPWSLSLPLPFFYFALTATVVAGPCSACWCARRSAWDCKAFAERDPHARARLQRLAAQVPGLRDRRRLRRIRRRVLGLLQRLRQPVDVQLVTSVETLLMVALGGPGTLAGPALGATLIVFLKNFVSVYTKRWLLILGAVYIGVILFAPPGCARRFQRRSA